MSLAEDSIHGVLKPQAVQPRVKMVSSTAPDGIARAGTQFRRITQRPAIKEPHLEVHRSTTYHIRCLAIHLSYWSGRKADHFALNSTLYTGSLCHATIVAVVAGTLPSVAHTYSLLPDQIHR